MCKDRLAIKLIVKSYKCLKNMKQIIDRLSSKISINLSTFEIE